MGTKRLTNAEARKLSDEELLHRLILTYERAYNRQTSDTAMRRLRDAVQVIKPGSGEGVTWTQAIEGLELQNWDPEETFVVSLRSPG